MDDLFPPFRYNQLVEHYCEYCQYHHYCHYPPVLKENSGFPYCHHCSNGSSIFIETYAGIDTIDTIGDRFTIKSELPDATMPALNWEAIKDLFPVAITIAVLGAIESLLSATVADGVTGDKHDSNTELIAQGTANLITPLFGGIPATGAIARTMTNINNGGKTPVAGIIHAVVLLLILLF